MEVVKAPEPKINPATWDFPKGAKFNMDQSLFFVKDATFESNTHFRTLMSEGNETIIMLKTLQRNASEADDFFVV